MSEQFAVISSQTNSCEAAKVMRNFVTGVLPITVSGELVGVLPDRDLVAGGIATGRPWTS